MELIPYIKQRQVLIISLMVLSQLEKKEKSLLWMEAEIYGEIYSIVILVM